MNAKISEFTVIPIVTYFLPLSMVKGVSGIFSTPGYEAGTRHPFGSSLACRLPINDIRKTCPCYVYPLNPLLYSKTGACRGIQVYTYFSYFCSYFC